MDSSQPRLRIAYLTLQDPRDRKTWSGINYYMASAMERHCGEVFRLGPLKPLAWKIVEPLQRRMGRWTGTTFFYTTHLAPSLGKLAEDKLAQGDYDVIVAPVGAAVVAHLRTELPIVYLSDATVRIMFDYYPETSNTLRSHQRASDRLEQLAIQKATQIIYPSNWAARSAIQDYGADPSKVHIVPMGANIESAPAREVVSRPLSPDKCRLLFVGVEWDRKGGDIAIETLLELERLGVASELTIVGCQPADKFSHPSLTVIPFINKNEPAGRETFRRLWTEADFFLLPTRAECFGIVFCEANAFGLPVLATATGGITEIVRDGINGFLFPLEARGDQYAARIQALCQNPTAYQALRTSSREEFDARLNWDSWANQVSQVLRAAVQSTGLAPLKREMAPVQAETA